jgi:hypothetical protein
MNIVRSKVGTFWLNGTPKEGKEIYKKLKYIKNLFHTNKSGQRDIKALSNMPACGAHSGWWVWLRTCVRNYVTRWCEKVRTWTIGTSACGSAVSAT